MARLKFHSDEGLAHEIRINSAESRVLIGRSKTCDIRTRNNTVSRQHACVTWENGAYHLVDLGSSNGTFFEGQRVTEHWLEDGDRFTCGAFKVEFELAEHERNLPSGEYDGPSFDAQAASEDEFSSDYPVADEVPDEAVAFDEGNGSSTDGSSDEQIAAAWRDLSFDGSDPALKVPVPATHLPFTSPDQDAGDSPPPIPTASIDDPDESEVLRDTLQPRSRFEEFNRQLELKNEELAELRENARVLEEDNLLLRTEVDALTTTITELRQQELSTHEFSELQHANEQLSTQATTLEQQLSERDERLSSLEAQILRDRESQVPTQEIDALKTAKEERDRLWEARERLEAELLTAKKQLTDSCDEGLDIGGDAAEVINALTKRLIEATRKHTEAETQSKLFEEAMVKAESEAVRIEETKASLETSLASVQSELTAAGERLVALEKENEALLATTADAESAAAALTSFEKDTRALRNEAQALSEQLRSERSIREELESAVQDRPTAEEHQAVLDALVSAQSAITELNEQVQSLTSESDRLADVQQQLADQEAIASSSAPDITTLPQFVELKEMKDALVAQVEALSIEKDEQAACIAKLTEKYEKTVASHKDTLKEHRKKQTATKKELDKAVKTQAALQGKLDSAMAAASDTSAYDRLQEANESLEITLQNQRKEIEDANARAAQAQESELLLQSKVNDMKAEQTDLLTANKSQVKRVSTLLKRIEVLEKNATEVSKLTADITRLEQDNALAQRQIADHQTVSEKLTETQAALAAAEGRIASVETEARAADERLQTATLELKQANAQLMAPSPLDTTGQLLSEIGRFIDEVNDRISAFRNNCETVRYCLDDIVAGRDTTDNQTAANDLLSENDSEVEALKKALRRFKNDHLKRAGDA